MTFYGYEMQLSKIYTRKVFNRFKNTMKSEPIFEIRSDTEVKSKDICVMMILLPIIIILVL